MMYICMKSNINLDKIFILKLEAEKSVEEECIFGISEGADRIDYSIYRMRNLSYKEYKQEYFSTNRVINESNIKNYIMAFGQWHKLRRGKNLIILLKYGGIF